jgi:hypothetical protein
MAVKVGGTEVITNARQLSNIASVDSATVTALGAAGVGGGGGSIELTAAAALSAGQAVIVNSSGQAAAVSQTISNAVFEETVNMFGGDNFYFDTAYFPNANYNGKGVYGTFLKRVSNGITYNQKRTVTSTGEIESQGDSTYLSNSAYGNGLSLTYGSGMDRALLAYGYDNSNELQFRGVSYSGLSLSSGSPVATGTHNYQGNKRIANCYDASHNKFFISADRGGSANLPIYVVSLGTGTSTPVIDTTHTVNASGFTTNYKYPEIASDNNGQFVMAVYDASQAKCRAVAFTVSGSTFSYGTVVEVGNDGQFNDSMSLRYDAPSGKFVITARTTSGINIRSITVGGSNAITLGTAVNASSSAVANCIVDSGGRGTALLISIGTAIQHRNITVASNGNITLGTAVSVTTSGQTSTWDSSRNLICRSTGESLTGVTAFLLVANYNYADIDANEYKNTVVSTNADFIGFTGGAINSGATGDITVISGVNDQQSGLTVGSKYYVTGSGGLSTSSSGGQYAGVATAATKLLVKG